MAQDVNRRRVPRRAFSGNIGVLMRGEYFVEKTIQVGEGGVSILFHRPVRDNTNVVVTFKIPGGSIVCVRGSIRYVESSDGKGGIPAGIQFENLDFHFKRELRNFVATATQENIFLGGA